VAVTRVRRSRFSGSRFEVRGSRFEVRGSRFEVRGSRFEVQGSRFEVQGSRFKVRGSRFEVQGSRFKVRGSPLDVRCSMFDVRCSMFDVRVLSAGRPMPACARTSDLSLLRTPSLEPWTTPPQTCPGRRSMRTTGVPIYGVTPFPELHHHRQCKPHTRVAALAATGSQVPHVRAWCSRQACAVPALAQGPAGLSAEPGRGTPARGCSPPQHLSHSLNGSSLAGGVGRKRSKSAGKMAGIFFLINEPAVALSGQASLEMSNLRTKKREDSGGGYTNQTAGEQRE
jgi:hypothetical protein